VAGLVRGDRLLLLEDDEPEARARPEQPPRGREPENPASDDDDVVTLRPLHGGSLYDRPA
jgi:hypothetical protein